MDAFTIMAAIYAAHETALRLTQSRIRAVREKARNDEARLNERMVRYSRVSGVEVPKRAS